MKDEGVVHLQEFTDELVRYSVVTESVPGH